MNGRLLSLAMRKIASHLLTFGVGCLIVVGPWIARNYISVGKLDLTEEYGSASLIERFAYNNMTAREFTLAFPYCVGDVGAPLVDKAFGEEAMTRFDYEEPGGFFQVGRGHREALIKVHGKLDPIIGGIIRDEMRVNWWRHLLVSVPLAWCGMWVGENAGLVLIPLFVWACVRSVRSPQPLFLFYAAPTLVMLGLHALIANESTRYELVLLGPLSVGAAWIVVSMSSAALTRYAGVTTWRIMRP